MPKVNPVSHSAKNRPVARAKLSLWPARSVTLSRSASLPGVAWRTPLSKSE
jgi:hypothetical protein